MAPLNYYILLQDGLKVKLADLQKELESTQSLLENETLQRVDFENKLQSMKEELLFKDRLHQEVATICFLILFLNQ